MRRIVAITRAPGGRHARLLRPGGRRVGRRLRGPGDLRQRRLPRPGRGGAGRRRQRRLGVVGGRVDARRAGGQGRQSGAGQGGRGVVDHRLRFPGLPQGRLLPDPSAVASRREVRRLRADPAAAVRVAAATPVEGDPRWPAGRRRALPAAREQRPGGRPRSDQQHHAGAIRRPLPADPQRPRRRAGGSGQGSRRRSSRVPTRRCGRPTGSSPSWLARTARWPSSPSTETPLWPRSPASASTSRGSSTTPTRPRKRPPSAARTSRPGSRSSPARCTSSA